MQQQAQIKQPRIAAPIAVMALLVDIPPFSPASSTKISSSDSSSIFVAATTIELIFQFCDQDILMLDFL